MKTSIPAVQEFLQNYTGPIVITAPSFPLDLQTSNDKDQWGIEVEGKDKSAEEEFASRCLSKINTKFFLNINFHNIPGTDIKVKLTLPQMCQLKVERVSGDINITKFCGDLKIYTAEAANLKISTLKSNKTKIIAEIKAHVRIENVDAAILEIIGMEDSLVEILAGTISILTACGHEGANFNLKANAKELYLQRAHNPKTGNLAICAFNTAN